MRFLNRTDAGRQLAARLTGFAGRDDVVVLALPRGGVPVASEIAAALRAPLDVLVVRKLGAPGQPEFAIGAIASGGVELVNEDSISALRLAPGQIQALISRETAELARREEAYRGHRPPTEVSGKSVIVVDDGMATGSTMRAAVAALRRQQAREIIVAAPVAAEPVCEALAAEADRVVCVWSPREFFAVGQWYEDFSQLTDDDVRKLLN